MTAVAGQQMIPFYVRAQAAFPILPSPGPGVPILLDDEPSGGQAWEHGLRNGIPVFQVAAGYVLPAGDAYHECGHSLDYTLDYWSTTVPGWHHKPFWDFQIARGVIMPASTWEEALRIGNTLSGMAQWTMLPGERWAECFKDAMLGKDPKALGFFKELMYQAKPALRPVSTPISSPLPPPTKGPSIDWLGPVPNTNYEIGRQGNPVALIVIHWMASSFDSALARFMTSGQNVSAHYLVSQTGRIAQVVKDEDTAYHAGDWNTNLLSISIEHEASPVIPPTDALYAASSWLLNTLAAKHGLDLIVDTTVKPHRAIVPTACPGTVDLNRLVEGADMTPEQSAKLDRLLALAEAREAMVWTARAQRILDVETGKPFLPSSNPIDPRIRQP